MNHGNKIQDMPPREIITGFLLRDYLFYNSLNIKYTNILLPIKKC